MGRKTHFFLIVAATLLFIPLGSAMADIYQFTDEQGVIHFSNVSVGNSKKFRRIKNASANEQRPSARQASPSRAALSTPKLASEYVDIIHAACNRHGIDPALVHAVVKVESNFNPYALSRKGAMGLMQLMPQTAADLNVRNTFNPDENINGGVKYLRYLIDRYDGNLSLALAAYNSGEGAVNKWGAVPPFKETQNYVQRILKIYNNNGGAKAYPARYTIYMGYGEDGSLLLTDNPVKQQGKKFKQKTVKNL